ncbi:MAG: NADH-quinone oxidoreductase subunit NuoF [Acidobacteriota bacterium]
MERMRRLEILVCTGTACVSKGAFELLKIFKEEIKKKELGNEAIIVPTGCNSLCGKSPLILIEPDGIFYHGVKEHDVPLIVEEHLLKGRPVKRLMYTPRPEEVPIARMSDIDFYKNQLLIVSKNRGLIDPEKIEEYLAMDGYTALEKALFQMSADQIIEEVKQSGLRGRGGAGFPTGLKWEITSKQMGNEKYLICNGDEGDPGAFMDRAILESDPHMVLEGMIIGAKAIGASHGFFYIREEYPYALKRVYTAIKQAREYGFLGENIFGTPFSFDVSVVKGAGAFVCGEETALIASVEGRLGEPRHKPPFPAEKGVWGKPTCINNVETWANIPAIINKGSQWFSSIGTATSKGTKVFSVAGKIRDSGLIEVPMGITLGHIIFNICGGIPQDRKFKAVQIGGPSGGFLPAKLLNLPVDYESLTEAGAIMGSGGLIVMDENTCLIDVVRYFLSFLKDESCGKCTPCREGTVRLFEIITRIAEGKGTMEDLDLLEELGIYIKNSASCGLGTSVPNTILTTIRYFRDEYESHIKDKRCPASICKELSMPPCMEICPIDTQAPAYIAYIAQGELREAFHSIARDNPLSTVCAKVCNQPCEIRCRCGEAGEPISIRNLKRFALEYGFSQGWKLPTFKNPKKYEKVAIVGAGPAGLMCGWELAKLGYQPTIFEAEPKAGGMLTLTIPEFRLPKVDVDREIDTIKRCGVEIKTGIKVGKDITLDQIFKQGYKAIFLATGAHKNVELGIPGENVRGVIDPIDFLKCVKRGERVRIGKKVVVVGGGNTAIDVARTAIRLESDVTILYRRTRTEMPANVEEIIEALEEGVKIEFLVAPKEVLSENGVVKALKCVRMILGEFDNDARRKPIEKTGSEFLLEVDTLIPAIGQKPDLQLIKDDYTVELSKWNTIVVDPKTMRTSRENIFAGGDVVTGPWTVIAAIGAGKRAARSMHGSLRNFKDVKEWMPEVKPIYVKPLEVSEEELEKIIEGRRPSLSYIASHERKSNFKEVSSGLSKELAIQEAKRCLRCDLERVKEEVLV